MSNSRLNFRPIWGSRVARLGKLLWKKSEAQRVENGVAYKKCVFLWKKKHFFWFSTNLTLLLKTAVASSKFQQFLKSTRIESTRKSLDSTVLCDWTNYKWAVYKIQWFLWKKPSQRWRQTSRHSFERLSPSYSNSYKNTWPFSKNTFWKPRTIRFL